LSLRTGSCELKPFIGFLIIRKQKKITFLFSLDVAATTLTSWHLMVTFCTLHAAQRLNLFESKSIDMKPVMLFGILNGVSIGLLNLSLGFNSIGFYQVHLNSTFTSKSVRQVDTVFFFFFYSLLVLEMFSSSSSSLYCRWPNLQSYHSLSYWKLCSWRSNSGYYSPAYFYINIRSDINIQLVLL